MSLWFVKVASTSNAYNGKTGGYWIQKLIKLNGKVYLESDTERLGRGKSIWWRGEV